MFFHFLNAVMSMQRVVVLSGAGVSAESGLKTFRGDDGLWEGKLFVFDDRMQMGFSGKAKDIADCEKCGQKTSNVVNSSNVRRKLHVICEKCSGVGVSDKIADGA